MTTTSTLGSAAGLDLNAVLARLEATKSTRMNTIKAQYQSVTTKLSAFGKVNDALSTLRSTAAALGKPGLFDTVKTSSSNANTLTAAAGTGATVGRHAITVKQLAQAQTVISGSVPDSRAAVGNGVIKIELGKTAGTEFTPDGGKPVSITIDKGNNSLEGIRDAINKSGAGVTASIMNDGTGSRLVVSSKEGGADSTIRISVSGNGTDSPAALAGVVGYDPAGASAMSQSQAGADAKLSVDGVDLTSKSNTVKDAAGGLTLTLTSTGTTVVNVEADTSSAASAIQALVNAYNAVQGNIASQSGYNSTTKTPSALVGERSLQTLQSQLRSALGDGASGSLADAGLAFNADGTLSLDADKLGAALTKGSAAVGQIFAGADGTTGVAGQIKSIVDKATGKGGLLTNAASSYAGTLTSLQNDYDAESARVTAQMTMYRAQFARIDMMVNRMQSSNSLLSQQFMGLGG
jgi:flagellar hook-associated protein 2